MHELRYALVACVIGALVPCPSSADVVSPGPKAQVRPNDVDWTRARHYDITLSEFQFAPSRITLQRGDPYALKLENKGRLRHTFMAPAFFRAVVLRPGAAASEAAASGGLSLGAGEVMEIDLVPSQPGTYALGCTRPLHGLFGMSGDIVVR